MGEKKWWIFATLCLSLVGGGLFAIADYSTESGDEGRVPANWPDGLQTMLEPDPARPTLIFFAHPLSPFAPASLRELESISNRLYRMVDVHILFFEPQDTSDTPDIWAAPGLKTMARRMPGTQLHKDLDGQLAKHFGAYESDQVLLYDTDGNLQFAGSIASSLERADTNPGRAAIISAIVSDKGVDPLAPRINPAFDCSLH